MITLIIAPNSDAQRLQKFEYQFLVFEWMGIGAIGCAIGSSSSCGSFSFVVLFVELMLDEFSCDPPRNKTRSGCEPSTVSAVSLAGSVGVGSSGFLEGT